MSNALASLSNAIAAVSATAAPWLVGVRVGPHAHLTGVAWADGLVVTTDQELQIRDELTLVLPGGTPVAGHLVQREPSLSLALLRTAQVPPSPPLVLAREPALGSLVVIVGSDGEGEATARLAIIRKRRGGTVRGAMLDLAGEQAEPGALVLDPMGAVLGLLEAGADGTVSIVPHAVVGRFVESAALRGAAPAPPKTARPAMLPRQGSRRGWFGIALQPITVPEPLVARAGQTSGRLIVGITAGGPAEEAGLRVGDVLLSLDRHSTSGANSLRTFLESIAIGSQIEARILRDTSVVTTWMTVAEQP